MYILVQTIKKGAISVLIFCVKIVTICIAYPCEPDKLLEYRTGYFCFISKHDGK